MKYIIRFLMVAFLAIAFRPAVFAQVTNPAPQLFAPVHIVQMVPVKPVRVVRTLPLMRWWFGPYRTVYVVEESK